MNRKLLLLNLALAGLLVYAGAQFRTRWREARAHHQQVLQKKPQTLPPPPVSPLPAQPPVLAAGYNDIAQKMLFDKSRNPNVPVELPPPPPPPPPMPALPVYHGAMSLPGEPPIAIMSTTASGAHEAIHPGEKIGQFKLLSVNTEELVLEWNNQQVRKRLDELMDKNAAAAAAPAVERTAQPAAAPEPVQQKAVGPVGEVSQFNTRACAQNDSYPAGAVVDGWRKVITQTAFGPHCRWDPVGR
jgi:hypothetical protein